MRRTVQACVLAVMVSVAALVAGPAGADGPPSPGPYPKLDFVAAGPEVLTCRDSDGTVLYEDAAWTLEPLVRGPAFAPVVVWLTGRGSVPVVPLDFRTTGYPLLWETADAGPAESGLVEAPVTGRPVGYGPAPTDPAPRVRCHVGQYGHYEYGTYTITAGLAAALGLPARLVGRRLRFDNEADISFSVPRYLFPLTATVVAPTLRTPDLASYGRQYLPTVTCGQRYRGAAYTLAPLVRGYRWAPMALWLGGDRIVTPSWFTATVSGTWRTVSGPARSGTLAVTQRGRPAGYGPAPAQPTAGVDCRWAGTHDTTTVVSPALAAQLKLPGDLVGRQVRLTGSYQTHAYVPGWLFPPAA